MSSKSSTAEQMGDIEIAVHRSFSRKTITDTSRVDETFKGMIFRRPKVWYFCDLTVD
jgi:hypothetical protein